MAAKPGRHSRRCAVAAPGEGFAVISVMNLR